MNATVFRRNIINGERSQAILAKYPGSYRTRRYAEHTQTSSTFGDLSVFVCARQCAVDLANELHVVEQGGEGIEEGKAHHV